MAQKDKNLSNKAITRNQNFELEKLKIIHKTRIFVSFFKYTCIAVIFVFVSKEFSGKVTQLTLEGVGIGLNTPWFYLCIILVVAVVILFRAYLRQQKVRIKYSEENSEHTKNLEMRFDPERSTSGLATGGIKNDDD